MDIPKDATMLLSFVNLKLRDYYSTIDDMCDDLNLDCEDIKSRLATIDYYYDTEMNRFV